MLCVMTSVAPNQMREKKRSRWCSSEGKNSFYARYVKRALDFALALLFLMLFWWLLLAIAFLVRVKLGTPVVFKQQRPGKDGGIFHIYKFRTMTDQKDENGVLLPDLQRLTPFGRRLRNSSLDELPEFFNVLKGDMSLVGPRPLLVDYLELYNEHQRHRHDVRPGITGYAQTHGRNAISWEERFDMDVEYTKSVSLRNDARILFATVLVVFRREGIDSAEGHGETMSDFSGTREEE